MSWQTFWSWSSYRLHHIIIINIIFSASVDDNSTTTINDYLSFTDSSFRRLSQPLSDIRSSFLNFECWARPIASLMITATNETIILFILYEMMIMITARWKRRNTHVLWWEHASFNLLSKRLSFFIRLQL